MTPRDDTPLRTKKRLQVEKLERNKETVPNLSEDESEAAKGGSIHPGGVNALTSEETFPR